VELIADSLDQLAQLVHLAVGEAPGRFIEQEQLGPRRERPGQLDALERAEGQSLGLVESDILEVKCREDVVGLGCNPPVAAKGARPAEDRLGEAHPRLGVGTENRVVEHAQGREEGKVLERPGDAEVSHSVRRCRKQLLAVESDATAVGLDDAGDRIEESRLTGTVWTDEAADFAVGNRGAELVERGHSSETNGHAIDRQHPPPSPLLPQPGSPGSCAVTTTTRVSKYYNKRSESSTFRNKSAERLRRIFCSIEKFGGEVAPVTVVCDQVGKGEVDDAASEPG